MARTAQISKEKQQTIITLKHEGQSTLKVQLQKPSSTMMKLALMRTATGKEDPVTSAAEDKFISYQTQNRQLTAPQIAAQVNKCFTEFK